MNLKVGKMDLRIAAIALEHGSVVVTRNVRDFGGYHVGVLPSQPGVARATANLDPMPTILVVEGYRFFFFSNEGGEPPHVHVEKGEGHAKCWLSPIRLAYSADLKRPQLRRIREIVFEHQQMFMDRWEEHFGG